MAQVGPAFVSTRYQGSKQRALGLIERALAHLRFDSVVDVFAGSGTVAHLFKRQGKRVLANDALASAHVTLRALIENDDVRLAPERTLRLFDREPSRRYGDVVERLYRGIYFTDDENRVIDAVCQNLDALAGHERDLGRHALFQACLKKRPFNLFHRKNLALRTREVSRSFGNKATWDAPLRDHFLAALTEANAAVFASGRPCRATNEDAFACALDAELVYLDPPYVRSDGASFDYHGGYHFLEGLSDYAGWPARVDLSRKHRPLRGPKSPFSDRRTARDALAALIDRARHVPALAISYRSDGTPSEGELTAWLREQGRQTKVFRQAFRYALSRRSPEEIVVVGSRPGC